MATDTTPPTRIALRKRSGLLALEWPDGRHHELPFEYLRVHSPSAEVRGHGPGGEVLQIGKEDVRIVRIEPVGHYALRLVFSDGHDTGLYTWGYLRELGEDREARWRRYLDRLAEAGYSRRLTKGDPDDPDDEGPRDQGPADERPPEG